MQIINKKKKEENRLKERSKRAMNKLGGKLKHQEIIYVCKGYFLKQKGF